MRLLIDIKAEKDFSYDVMYYHKLQGFVYSLIRNTEYEKLHDKKGYKFFCFSNIFPCSQNKSIHVGDRKQFIIASPDKMLISIIKERMEKMRRDEFSVGNMLFSISNIKSVNPIIMDNCVIKTATPIIMRIPKYMYETYGIKSDYDYVFWRPEHDFNAFLKQLSENLIKNTMNFITKI
ncbi:MAG: hypothetical protein V1870_02700 [Candidatus Aenigmatarchaeota archaeon]